MRARPRSSNDRVGRAARASVRKAQGLVRDATVTVAVPTKGMRTGATTAPPSRATEDPARDGMATPGVLTHGPAVARRLRRLLVATTPAARRIFRPTALPDNGPRMTP